MALYRRSGTRFGTSIWPGFVDAMTALLLILFFVLSIFMIVQFALREQISGQGKELDILNVQLLDLTQILGMERRKISQLETDLGISKQNLITAEEKIKTQNLAILELVNKNNSLLDVEKNLTEKVNAFEVQVAKLLIDQQDLKERNAQTLNEKEAIEQLLAQAYDKIETSENAIRLAITQREILETLVADQENQIADMAMNLKSTQVELDEIEKERQLEQAAAMILQERLKKADAELSAMTLALEAQRKKAEETLILYAAAQAAKKDLTVDYTKILSQNERRAALLTQAKERLSKEKEISIQSQKQLALLNAQTQELRAQLNELQNLLDISNQRDAKSKNQLELLGKNLNAALARVASEQKKRAELEQKERERLEIETRDLKKFKSDFFGRLRQVMENKEGVMIVGDRFVFPSEVLFSTGSADLDAMGKLEIKKVATIIQQLASEIPPDIDWILRVDGHTDKIPFNSSNEFTDNWALSQARALSVVRYLINDLGLPPNRLAANGFGEFQPIDPRDTLEAYEINRRIELKFTEK